jgi:hypothetical protein
VVYLAGECTFEMSPAIRLPARIVILSRHP